MVAQARYALYWNCDDRKATTYRLYRGQRPANYEGPWPDNGLPRDNEAYLSFYLKTVNLCFANKSIMMRMVHATRSLLDIKKKVNPVPRFNEQFTASTGRTKGLTDRLRLCVFPGVPLSLLLLSDPTVPGRHYHRCLIITCGLTFVLFCCQPPHSVNGKHSWGRGERRERGGGSAASAPGDRRDH